MASLLTVSCRCRQSHDAALCRSGFYHLRQLRDYVHSVGHYQQKLQRHYSTCVHFMSPGLLQLAAVRSDRQTHATSTVAAECCGKADHRSETSQTLYTSHRYCVNFIGCRSDDELNSRLPSWYIYQVLSSKVPTYLADDINLASQSSARSLSLLFGECSVTPVHSRFGDRCFAAAGPRIWNNLPAGLHCKTMKSAAQNSEDN